MDEAKIIQPSKKYMVQLNGRGIGYSFPMEHAGESKDVRNAVDDELEICKAKKVFFRFSAEETAGAIDPNEVVGVVVMPIEFAERMAREQHYAQQQQAALQNGVVMPPRGRRQ